MHWNWATLATLEKCLAKTAGFASILDIWAVPWCLAVNVTLSYIL